MFLRSRWTVRPARCLLVAESMFVPTRVETEVFKHLQVPLDGLVERGQIIADHQSTGARHKDHALHVAEIYGPPTRDHDFLTRQNKAETSDGFKDFKRRQRGFRQMACRESD
jgi:hypothetical protein